jgi:hypothetical protein
MNNKIQEIAVRAWQHNADIEKPPEEWMAGFIDTLGLLLIEECLMVINTDISAHDDFGKAGGQGMKRAADIVKRHFGIKNEIRN